VQSRETSGFSKLRSRRVFCTHTSARQTCDGMCVPTAGLRLTNVSETIARVPNAIFASISSVLQFKSDNLNVN